MKTQILPNWCKKLGLAIFGIILSILLYAFSKEIKLGLDYFLTLFMCIFLITLFFEKQFY